MMMVSMIKRRLKEGKTYEDFRRAWYHNTGFGIDSDSLKELNHHWAVFTQ